MANIFALIPGLQPAQNSADYNVWNDLPMDFELNEFYRSYSSAEGEIGNGYIAIWPEKFVREFCNDQERDTDYSLDYRFFGSDSIGTMFGFKMGGEGIIFVSAPDIGDKDDIVELGNWSSFLKRIQTNDYI